MKYKIKILKEQLLFTTDEVNKISIHNNLARAYMYRDSDAVIHHANQALKLSQKYENTKEEARSYFNLGAAKFLSQDLKMGVDYYHQANLLCSPDDHTLKTRIYMGICLTYANLHCFEKALYYGEKALNIATVNELFEEQCTIYNNHGHIYNYLGDFELSEKFLTQGLNIAIEKEFYWKQVFLTYNIARGKLNSGNTNVEALIFTIESLIEKRDEMWYLGPVQILWALYYILTDSYENAISKIELGLQILEEEKQDFYYLLAITDLTMALNSKNHVIEAEGLYKNALAYFEKENHMLSLSNIYLKLSNFYSEHEEVILYQKYLRKYVSLKSDLEHYINKFF